MASKATASTAHGRRTRERLLRATAELVAARGFHAVGIADIGAAAGVTGSAIYRHFSTKQEMLAPLLDRVIDELLGGARKAREVCATPQQFIETLVRMHVDFSIRDKEILLVYQQEVHNLPPADRKRLRRKQHNYADIWVEALRDLRPELSSAEALTVVHATFGLLNSVANFKAAIQDRDATALLASMAGATLRHARLAMKRQKLTKALGP